MRKSAIAALMAGVTWGAVVPAPALALECTYMAPRRPNLPDTTADSSQPSSSTGRSGSEGPSQSSPARETSRAGEEPSGGPGARHPAAQEHNKLPRLDVDSFLSALDRRLDRNTAGYVLQLRKDGVAVRTEARRWARRPAEGGINWDADQRMHVASISKLVTAIAVVRLLDDKRVDVNAKIAAYLPTHWTRGPGVDQVTFAQLLRHETGFETGTYFADYRFMQDQVARGTTREGGVYRYQNINFALLRVLMPILNGDIAADAKLSDVAWDDRTFEAYAAYVQRVVFTPAGVTGATLIRPPTAALAYTYRGQGAGWESGKLGCTAGAAAWYMSVNEVLDVLGSVRRGGAILPAARAQWLFDQRFGIDRIEPAGAAKLYVKSGAWWDGPRTRMEQTVAFILPEGLELVAFANSPIGADNANFVSLVTELYFEHVRYR